MSDEERTNPEDLSQAARYLCGAVDHSESYQMMVDAAKRLASSVLNAFREAGAVDIPSSRQGAPPQGVAFAGAEIYLASVRDDVRFSRNPIRPGRLGDAVPLEWAWEALDYRRPGWRALDEGDPERDDVVLYVVRVIVKGLDMLPTEERAGG